MNADKKTHKIVLNEKEAQVALVDFARKKVGISGKIVMQPFTFDYDTKEFVVVFDVLGSKTNG